MRTIAKLLALGNWESNEKNRSTPYCIAEEIVGSIAARFPLGHTPFFEELVVAQTVLAQHIACKLQLASKASSLVSDTVLATLDQAHT